MRIAIAILFASCAMALADGGTNCFPTWQHVQNTRGAAKWVYTGLVERCAASGVAAPDAPWFATQRSRLKTYKTTAKGLLPHFLYLRGNTNSAGALTNFIAGAGSSPQEWDAPVWTLATLCRDLQIPTNYFDKTPWTALSGYGSYTTDIAAVGHPHGETNAYTVAGGTNFPPGRSAWYTTDYGWDSMRAIISALDVTDEDVSLVGRERMAVFDATNSDWSALRAAFIAHAADTNNWSAYTLGAAILNVPQAYFGTNEFGDYRITDNADLVLSTRSPRRGGITMTMRTNYTHSADLYGQAFYQGTYLDWSQLAPTPNEQYRLASFASSTGTNITYAYTNNFAEAIPVTAPTNAWSLHAQQINTYTFVLIRWVFDHSYP